MPYQHNSIITSIDRIKSNDYFGYLITAQKGKLEIKVSNLKWFSRDQSSADIAPCLRIDDSIDHKMVGMELVDWDYESGDDYYTSSDQRVGYLMLKLTCRGYKEERKGNITIVHPRGKRCHCYHRGVITLNDEVMKEDFL